MLDDVLTAFVAALEAVEGVVPGVRALDLLLSVSPVELGEGLVRLSR
jgi:hypothetical protein